MKDFFKRLKEKISEAWYAALPLLILIGIPLLICLIIVGIKIYPEIPVIIMKLTNYGDGSLFTGILKAIGVFILFIFAGIWALNTFYAYGAAIEKFDETGLSYKWFVIFIIVSIIGFISSYTLAIILK